jgi:hypothetical protein
LALFYGLTSRIFFTPPYSSSYDGRTQAFLFLSFLFFSLLLLIVMATHKNTLDEADGRIPIA